MYFVARDSSFSCSKVVHVFSSKFSTNYTKKQNKFARSSHHIKNMMHKIRLLKILTFLKLHSRHDLCNRQPHEKWAFAICRVKYIFLSISLSLHPSQLTEWVEKKLLHVHVYRSQAMEQFYQQIACMVKHLLANDASCTARRAIKH